jgi:hypothetical protein
MSKFIQSHYEAAILELRSIPFEYTNNYYGPEERKTWYCSTPRILLAPKHYDIINSLYSFFQYHGYNNWGYKDFFDHMKKIAFERNWKNTGYMYQPFDFVHGEKKSRWFRHTDYYRHKRSYQRKDHHQKKEKKGPRWSDKKRSWKKEHHQSGWKKCMKDTTIRSIRAETKKRMATESYDDLITHHKKHHWYDYW